MDEAGASGPNQIHLLAISSIVKELFGRDEPSRWRNRFITLCLVGVLAPKPKEPPP
jgi:hypothetical protein